MNVILNLRVSQAILQLVELGLMWLTLLFMHTSTENIFSPSVNQCKDDCLDSRKHSVKRQIKLVLHLKLCNSCRWNLLDFSLISAINGHMYLLNSFTVYKIVTFSSEISSNKVLHINSKNIKYCTVNRDLDIKMYKARRGDG